MNRYFKLLANLVSCSIIFQLLLIIGYNPTLVSVLLFTFSVLITLTSFIFFGRYSLIYFNAGNLVVDLIENNNLALRRYVNNKEYFKKNNKGGEILTIIGRNIQKIRLIVEESSKPQLSNTNFRKISNDLLTFSISYNSIKHKFPSNKSWHRKINVHKKWEEASSTELNIFNSTGSSLIPKSVEDYINIEKQIIENQFFIFENIEKVAQKNELIYNQLSYIQTIAFQCEFEIYKLLFDRLEKTTIKTIDKTNIDEYALEYQAITIYANLFIQYLVGFNYNFDRLITENNIRKLAIKIHTLKNIDDVFNYPYKLRMWIDNYQVKLRKEIHNEGNVRTPLFYTEYELAKNIQLIFKEHLFEVSLDLINRIPNFSKLLKETKSQYAELNAFVFLNESLDTFNKIDYFSNIVKSKIDKTLNNFNLKKAIDFEFSKQEKLLKESNNARIDCINEIWEVGNETFEVNNKDIPDMFGVYYQIINKDIVDKAFFNNSESLKNYIHKYYKFNILYIFKLKEEINGDNLHYISSKLFPLIVDLFEVSSISFIMARIHNLSNIEEEIFNYWDIIFKDDEVEELNFWKFIMGIYNYFNHTFFSLSSSSFVNEVARKRRLEDFLKESDFVRLENQNGSGRFPLGKIYVSNINDYYIKSIVTRLSTGYGSGLKSDDLSELFIEFYLRSRIALKSLEIKETNYGSNLKRFVERDIV
ncbi:hypothetical protein [uncultured Lutibacter sp.]|uniref:hypothetical protein n=1 Tax=uncultured Lutibacter sp. TaxID=437739 RepID=UPI002608DE02|nr:hypothetical protein [uncultured Lutibacter sp.]